MTVPLSSAARPRRTITWKAVFVLSMMTLFAWASLYIAPPSLAAMADETAATDAAHTDGTHGADHEAGHAGGHPSDPVAEVLLAITVILFLAKVVGDVFERIGLPAVLGELSIGIMLGNWAFFTSGMFGAEFGQMFDFLKPGEASGEDNTGVVLDMLSRIGVVLLLFEVGLESRVREMVSVGVSSLLVALLGVVAPMGLGYAVGYVVIPEAGWQVHAFLGATLCATSVGITARVLKDLGRSQDRESRIILGAAVIDDVLGLVVLAVVSGVISSGEFEIVSLLKIVGLSFAFLAGALALGAIQLPRILFKAASALRGHGLLVTTALAICFLFSWGADKVGLASIIGAFAAGLILEGAHYQEVGEKWKNHHLEDAIAPLSALLVPIFFVATGMAVDLSQFGGGGVWTLAIGLTVVAILGKQVCSFGVREPGLNKFAVGIGMIPRGEVGLIFAKQGQDLKMPGGDSVIDNATFSAIVVMVMVTTMITPPLLKWAMSKPDDATEPSPSETPPS